jgi:hypothetical protein
VQLGDALGHFGDGGVQRRQGPLAGEEGERRQIVFAGWRQEPEQARQRRRHGRVVQLEQIGKQVHGLLETGDPGQQGFGDGVGGSGCDRGRGGPAIVRAFAFEHRLRLEDEGIEAAEFGERAAEGGPAPEHEAFRAQALGGGLGFAPAVAALVEDVRQPFVGLDQARLDDDAAEEAVEHDDVERLERLRDVGKQLVELDELGFAEIVGGGGDRRPRRRHG